MLYLVADYESLEANWEITWTLTAKIFICFSLKLNSLLDGKMLITVEFIWKKYVLNVRCCLLLFWYCHYCVFTCAL